MIVGQLPSLEQIYDFSSEDLRQIVNRLHEKISKVPVGSESREDLQQYIENVNIELEERKTLEFFQEMCAVDNPYVKKVTDFNNEFLKLAGQAIAQSEPQLQSQPPSIEPQKQQRFQQYDSIDNKDAVSVTSAASKTTFTQSKQSESQSRQGKTHTRKMGLGGNKSRTKNSMKEFILSTLNKGKNQGCYVIKKGGPPKPQPAYTVNERGHLVSSNTLQPISTKSIKSSSSVKTQNTPLASTKQVSEVPPKPSEKELEKKRQQVAEKLKGNKPQKKKEKHLNNKQLVEMIRLQQKQKEIKKNKPHEQKQNKKEILQSEKKIQKGRLQEKTQQICQQIQVQESVNNLCIQESAAQEEIKQEITVQDLSKVQKNEMKQEPKVQIIGKKEKIEQDPLIKPEDSIQRVKALSIDSKVVQQQDPEQSLEKQITADKTNEKPQLKIQEQEAYKAEMEELKQIKKQAQQFDQKLQQMTFKKKDEPFGVIIDLTPQNVFQEKNENTLKKQQEQKAVQPKRCYNQEYWIHIRQQAELKIKRFREEKEIQQSSKQKLKKAIKESVSDKIEKEEKQNEETMQEKVQTEQKTSTIEVKTQDEFYQKKKKELKKMMADHKKRVAVPKRVSAAVVAPPKPLYALPTFNYLQIYPTFNHIFSVMYTKAEHQAIQDIPSIMKDLTNIFTSHVNHFKNKNTHFQAGIFLPFDSGNKFQMTDPKQLLVHTQGTYVNLKKMVERLQIFNSNLHGEFNEGNQRYYRVVKTKEEVYDIITTGFLRRKFWKELPHGCSLRSSWNLFWSWSKPDIDISKLLVWQRINHFPFNKNLSRKDLLYKNLDSFRRMLKIPFNFLPLTFNLPKEYTQFSMKFHEQQMLNRDMNYWIMKPIGKSRGRGIKVISNLAQLNYTDNIVVQKYITNPLLLDGYKFDMRIYVLVTNFHPLEAFVYREGFARLSTEKFSLEPMMMKNAFIHLTNFAVNKNNQEAKQTSHFSGGSKISLKALKDRLTKMDYSFNSIWCQVHEIIIKSLLGCSISVPSFPAAFELFGYDIMIDTQGSCHLIEINASPSLQRTYLIDQIVKQSLIDDILDIVDPPEFDKQQLLDIMSDRLSGRTKVTPEEDLTAIARCLKYKPIRKFGQMPQNMGLFERVAPSQMSGDLERLIKGRSGANNPRNID